MRHIAVVLLAVWFLLTGAALAWAGPVLGAIAAIGSFLASGTILAQIALAAIFTAVKVGISLLTKAKKTNKEAGVASDVTFGGKTALSFLMGNFATPGHLEYTNSYGTEDKTPNAFLVTVLSLGDLPSGLSGLWIDDKLVELPSMVGSPPDEKGWVIDEFNDGSTPHLWVRFLDGSQTATDPFLLAKFGSDPDRPITSDMIWLGVPLLIVTARVNSKIFNGFPQPLAESPGIAFYDPRKDSTVGGSGAHRWGTASTYEPSSNNIVQAYNVMRGIYYGDEHLWGGRCEAWQLPVANWMAAMNACDLAIDLAEGGTEPQFRAGGEVFVDEEPLSVVEELIKAANGTFANLGGYYKVSVGAPAAPVYSFTDATLVVTEGRTLDPFPALDQTYNGAQASYPEPAEKWGAKDAPAYLRSDLELLDDNRHLVTGLQYPYTPHAIQVQRLLQATVEDGRCFLVHMVCLPPEADVVEAGDTVAWSSDWNQYTNKKFIVVEKDVDSKLLQYVMLREVDPSNHTWNPLTDQRAYSIGFIGSVVPPSQPTVGCSVFAHILYDSAANARRPTIGVRFPGDLDDVSDVIVTVRLKSSGAAVSYTSKKYGAVGAPASVKEIILDAGPYLPATEYEVEILLVPASDRRATPTAWLSVLTDDIRLGSDDIYPIDIGQLNEELQDLIEDMQVDIEDLETATGQNIAAIAQETLDRAAADLAEASARIADTSANALRFRDLAQSIAENALRLTDVNLEQFQAVETLRTDLLLTAEGIRAAYKEEITVATGPGSALVLRIETLEAEVTGLETNTLALIQSEALARASGDAAEASSRQTLAAQLRGNYTGTDLAALSEGLIYQERITRVANDEALSEQITLLSAGTGEQFDYAVIWRFDTTIESWTGNGTPTWVAGGYLRPANHATDPYVVSPTGLAVNGNQYTQVKLRVRKFGTPTFEGYAWWRAAADATWDAGRRETFAEPSYDANGIGVIVVNMPWAVTVDRIRIDLSTVQDASNYFIIDWIAIGRPSPGASSAQLLAEQLARASADTAEATARQALSSALVGATDPTGLTLEALTDGLVFDERTARSTADTALAEIIELVEVRLTDAEADIDLTVAALTTQSARVDAVEDDTIALTQLANDLNVALAGKADVGITDDLQGQITELGGGEGIEQIGRSVTAIRNELQPLALRMAEQGLQNHLDRIGVQSALAAASNSLDTKISFTNDQLNILAFGMMQVQAALPGKADSTVTSALNTRLTVAENEIVVNASALTLVQAQIDNPTTGLASRASAAALTLLDTEVSEIDDEVNALSTSMTQVEASVDGITAAANLRFVAVAGPAGYSSRIHMQARVGGAGAYRAASLFLDVPAASGSPTRLAAVAEQFIVTDGSVNAQPFVIIGGVAYLNSIKVNFADIQNVSIGTGQIQNAAITTAKIGNLQVVTSNLDFDTVTDSNSGSVGGTVISNTAAWTVIAVIPVNNANPNPVFCEYSLAVTANFSSGANGMRGDVRIRRSFDNSIFRTIGVVENVVGQQSTNAISGVFTIDMSITQGTYNYIIEALKTPGAGAGGSVTASGSFKGLWWLR